MGWPTGFPISELVPLYLLGSSAIISLTGCNMLQGLVGRPGSALPSRDRARIPRQPDDAGSLDQRILRSGVNLTAVLIGCWRWADPSPRRSGQSSTVRPGRQHPRHAQFPTGERIGGNAPAAMRGTLAGPSSAAIPGAGATPAALIPIRLRSFCRSAGKVSARGSVEGIAANEAAQNASNSGE